jgi:hypothetical protein
VIFIIGLDIRDAATILELVHLLAPTGEVVLSPAIALMFEKPENSQNYRSYTAFVRHKTKLK